jgi:CBS domain containing-hemolysin-like protein
MKPRLPAGGAWRRGSLAGRILAASAIAAALTPGSAHASIFHGETLDAIAGVLAWIVLIIVPIVAIVVFWLVHILPEKIAEKKHHPQAKAIQTLCLLSLVFGGILWPLAWLWAYTKPVLYRMAYGTDKGEEGHGEKAAKEGGPEPPDDEVRRLKARIAELEGKHPARPATGGV